MGQNIDLAHEDLTLLHAIVAADHEISTSTLREQMHWATSSRQVRYRLDKLEERELIETRRDDKRTPDHQMPVRVASPTNAGREIAAEFREDPGTLPLTERMEQVERQLSTMRETYGEVKRRIVAVESDLEEYDEDLDGIARQIRALQRVVEEESCPNR